MEILDALRHVLATAGIQVNVSSFLIVFGLALARIGTAVSLAPFMGGQSVTPAIKVGLAVMVVAVLLPGLSAQQEPVEDAAVFVALLVKEVLIGALIGFLTQLMLYAIQMAGALMDMQRGMNQPGLFAPQLPGHVSVLGQLQFQAALVLFLSMNGHLIFIRALARSFEQLPLFRFPPLSAPFSLAQQFGHITGQVFVVALQLSGPVLLSLFLVDVLFGAIGKIAPQVNVYHESQPVKALAGLVVFLLGLGFLFTRLEDVLGQMIWNISTVLGQLA
jgi:flagellar biosynthetic protein FliR